MSWLDLGSSAPLRVGFNQTSLRSRVALQFARSQQTHCARAVPYRFEPQGFGSNLHRWALALCHASAASASLITVPPWAWEDESLCSPAELQRPLSCYFQQNPCSSAQSVAAALNGSAIPTWVSNPRLGRRGTGNCALPEKDVYSGAVQLLFTSVSPKLRRVAEDAAVAIFGSQGAPRHLISVHIRW